MSDSPSLSSFTLNMTATCILSSYNFIGFVPTSNKIKCSWGIFNDVSIIEDTARSVEFDCVSGYPIRIYTKPYTDTVDISQFNPKTFTYETIVTSQEYTQTQRSQWKQSCDENEIIYSVNISINGHYTGNIQISPSSIIK